jgi:hypothetical protein
VTQPLGVLAPEDVDRVPRQRAQQRGPGVRAGDPGCRVAVEPGYQRWPRGCLVQHSAGVVGEVLTSDAGERGCIDYLSKLPNGVQIGSG